jgi:hypothetical protein
LHSWILQIAFTAAATLYLGHCRLVLHRRSTQSWDQLLSRLTPEWQALSAAEAQGAAGRSERLARLRELGRNAQVLQEIAGHALYHLDSQDHALDRALAEQLHRDATQLRFRVLAALVQSVLAKP